MLQLYYITTIDNNKNNIDLQKQKSNGNTTYQKSNGLLWIIIVAALAIGVIALIMHLQNNNTNVDYTGIEYSPDSRE